MGEEPPTLMHFQVRTNPQDGVKPWWVITDPPPLSLLAAGHTDFLNFTAARIDQQGRKTILKCCEGGRGFAQAKTP